MKVDEKEAKKGSVHVFDNYYIDVDSMNFTVVKQTVVRTGKRKGETNKTTFGYFGTLEDAVNDILEEVVIAKIQKKEVLELNEAFEIYKKEFKKFEKLLKNTKKEIKNG